MEKIRSLFQKIVIISEYFYAFNHSLSLLLYLLTAFLTVEINFWKHFNLIWKYSFRSLVKIRMIKSLFQRNPVCWVPSQHFLQNVNATYWGLSKYKFNIVFAIDAAFLHLLSQRTFFLGVKFWPIIFCRISYQFTNHLELMYFTVTLEQRNSLLQ